MPLPRSQNTTVRVRDYVGYAILGSLGAILVKYIMTRLVWQIPGVDPVMVAVTVLGGAVAGVAFATLQ